MSDLPLAAGAAATGIRPHVGLPMVGFVRRQTPATGEGLPLEATALLLERGGTRVLLCGVDTIGIPGEEVDELRRRIGAAISADPAGILLNWNHTHSAPPPGRAMLLRSGLLETTGDDDVEAYGERLGELLVQLAIRAAEALEPAAVTWGQGCADISVNRRERDRQGRIVHGWRADGIVDQQVTTLQAQRADGSPIATVVSFGCHPVAGGMDLPVYSSDYPGALRIAMRRRFGGECVFLQGAAGNVLPRVSFGPDEGEATLMGERLALEAAHSVADRPARPTRMVVEGDASLIPMILFRRAPVDPGDVPLAAIEERVTFPLGPVPSREEAVAMAEAYAAERAEAESRGAGPAELHGIGYHAKWARALADDLAAGRAITQLEGPIHAVRIGDGLILSTPGELFTELGWAIKQRAPGLPTAALGYTNGTVGYLPTAEAYPEGGYEPAYSNRSYGTPATVAPACARMIVETAVRTGERLFPERERFEGDDWSASGPLPELPPMVHRRPDTDRYDAPPVAVPPQ
jgi:neutral ceramidase